MSQTHSEVLDELMQEDREKLVEYIGNQAMINIAQGEAIVALREQLKSVQESLETYVNIAAEATALVNKVREVVGEAAGTPVNPFKTSTEWLKEQIEGASNES